MKVDNRLRGVKNSGAICGLIFSLLVSGQALANCELEEVMSCQGVLILMKVVNLQKV